MACLVQKNRNITESQTFKDFKVIRSESSFFFFYLKHLRHAFLAIVFSLSFKRQCNSTGDMLSYNSQDTKQNLPSYTWKVLCIDVTCLLPAYI